MKDSLYVGGSMMMLFINLISSNLMVLNINLKFFYFNLRWVLIEKRFKEMDLSNIRLLYNGVLKN